MSEYEKYLQEIARSEDSREMDIMSESEYMEMQDKEC